MSREGSGGAHSELASLLQRASESELEAFLFGSELLSSYDPRPESLSLHAWVEEIVHLLAGGSPREQDRLATSRARRTGASIARSALSGTVDPLVASHKLAGLSDAVDVAPDDPDFITFVAINSETDHLPVGVNHELLAPNAVFRLERELASAREWALAYGHAAFQSVASRFDGS